MACRLRKMDAPLLGQVTGFGRSGGAESVTDFGQAGPARARGKATIAGLVRRWDLMPLGYGAAWALVTDHRS